MASRRIVGLIGISNRTCGNNILRFSSNKSVVLESAKQVTHTGQIYDEDDYRNVRFVTREKEVNHNWAINLIAEEPPKPAKERIVACDGGGGPLGHPKVYINLDKPGDHCCGYCGLRFYKEDHH